MIYFLNICSASFLSISVYFVFFITKYSKTGFYVKQTFKNKRQIIQKVQSKIDNPEKLETQAHKTKTNKTITQHSTDTTTHKQHMSLPTNNWKQRRTQHCSHAESQQTQQQDNTKNQTDEQHGPHQKTGVNSGAFVHCWGEMKT